MMTNVIQVGVIMVNAKIKNQQEQHVVVMVNVVAMHVVSVRDGIMVIN